MKVIAINGSARNNGNTTILINKAFEELNKESIETELIELAGTQINGCKACWACGGKENCVNRNDNFREIFEKMKEADGIILGSPSYSANVSANMQALIERAAVVCDMNVGLMTHKIGASISVQRRTGALQTMDTMNHFFLNHEMYVVGSSYWNIAIGQMPGDVEKDEEAMRTVENLGKNMAFLLKAIKQ